MNGSDCRDQIATCLRAAPVFQGVDAGFLDALLESAWCSRHVRRQVLAQQGQRPDELLVVLDGELSISRFLQGRGRMHMRTLSPGHIVGWSVIAGHPHSADLVAHPQVRVGHIPGIAVRTAVRQVPELAPAILRALGDVIDRLSDEIQNLRFLTLGARLLRLLEERADAEGLVRGTQAQWAEELGVRRENVSRELSRLRAAGVVETGRGWVRLRRRL